MLADLLDELLHLCGRRGVRAADGVGFDLGEGPLGGVAQVGGDVADAVDHAQDLHAAGQPEQLAGDGPRGHPGGGLAGGAAAAAAEVPEAVLGVEGVVRVPGAVLPADVPVVPAALVLVADEHGDRGPGGPALEHAREDLRLVGLVPGRDDPGLARPPAGQVGRQVLDAQRQPRGAAVDDHHVARAVGLAGGGDAEERAVGGSSHGSVHGHRRRGVHGRQGGRGHRRRACSREAERVGFEPTNGVTRYRFSKPAPSATRPPLQVWAERIARRGPLRSPAALSLGCRNRRLQPLGHLSRCERG